MLEEVGGGGGLGVGRRADSFVDATRRQGARAYFTDYRLCCTRGRGTTGSGDTDGKGWGDGGGGVGDRGEMMGRLTRL